MSPQLTQARLLMQHGKYDLAEQSLRAALGQEPNDAEAHALMGICLARMERHAQAAEAARRAVELEPNNSFSHFALGLVLHQQHKFKDSIKALEQAIEMAPFNAENHSIQAHNYLNLRKWDPALRSAEAALELDPEHVEAANCRAAALRGLGRHEESARTLQAALNKDPENADTHANQGWACLHGGDAHKAAEHFKEALRLDPQSEWARQGIVEALKAKNLLYRGLLRYMNWVSSISESTRWGMLIGTIVLLQLLVRLPENGPLLWLGLFLSIVYLVFIIVALNASPFFELLLRLDPFGRLVLSDDERKDTNWMGLGLLAVGALAAVPIIQGYRVLDAINYLLLMLALGVTLSVPRAAKRKLAAGITFGLFAAAVVYCYRWHVAPPFDVGNSHAFAQFTAELIKKPEKLEEFKEYINTQQTLRNSFAWGSILMTWVGPVLSRR